MFAEVTIHLQLGEGRARTREISFTLKASLPILREWKTKISSVAKEVNLR